MAEPISTLAWLRGAGSLLSAYGFMESGKSAKIAGERARAAAEFEAWQAEQEGMLAIAIGQRQAMEERRQGDILASRALAVAAASGGGVSDPTIVNLISRTKGEAAYRASVALYEGEAKSRSLRLQAAIGRAGGAETAVEGIRSQTGYTLAAGGKLFEGAASLYARYGGKGPSGDSGLVKNNGQT